MARASADKSLVHCETMNALLRLPVFGLYAVFVLEIIFMISPVAVHFYAVHGPLMKWMQATPATAWLTQFFLPHFSQTSSHWLNLLHPAGELLLVVGGLVFLAAAVPLYWSKWRGKTAMTKGIYSVIRHPQYVGLAIIGCGTVLLWPRFVVAVSCVLTCWLYGWLAANEERRCLRQFGDDYRRYQEQTGAVLPRRIEQFALQFLPSLPAKRRALFAAALPTLLAASVLGGMGLRTYALGKLSALWTPNVAVLSVVRMSETELSNVWNIAKSDSQVTELFRTQTKFIVHVVPSVWYLADLPIESERKSGDHHTPADFDRTRLNVLITRAVTHAPNATGSAIVTTAIQRKPLLLVAVDVTQQRVLETRTPPQHVLWGDISTPFF